jgi:hypothetical protein
MGSAHLSLTDDRVFPPGICFSISALGSATCVHVSLPFRAHVCSLFSTQNSAFFISKRLFVSILRLLFFTLFSRMVEDLTQAKTVE